MCWATIAHCEKCDLTLLAKNSNNLYPCRTIKANGYSCDNMLCKPCGNKDGGCSNHYIGPGATTGGWPGKEDTCKESWGREVARLQRKQDGQQECLWKVKQPTGDPPDKTCDLP